MGEGLKKINVFLIKEGVTNTDDVIKLKADAPDDPKRVDLIPIADIEEGAFYVGKSKQKDPEWLSFLNQFVEEEQHLEKNTTNSAVLVLKVEGRLLAFCFGYGRFLVDINKIERGFGLKVAINIIDPVMLRSLDYKKYEDIVLYTRQQVSKGSSLSAFEIDINAEILRNIGGRVKDETIGKSVNGADAVIINLNESIERTNIAAICSELLALYKEDAYKESFDWVDNFMPINDAAVIADLDNRLLTVINESRHTDFHMAPPEIFAWEDYTGFSFSTEPEKAGPRIELESKDYIETIKDELPLDIAGLKKHQVRAKSTETDQWYDMWPVYDCIIFETSTRNNHYVLHEGSWFRVEKQFADRLNEEIKNIPKADIELPTTPLARKDEVINFRFPGEANIETHYEKYFNEYVGWQYGDKVTMDRRNVKPTHSTTPIEFCDIFTDKGQFVHVKPGTSSSKLSHLFKQGSVSAELFLEDSELRKKIKELIINDPVFGDYDDWEEEDKRSEQEKRQRLADLVPSDHQKVERDKFEVVYCIISNIPDEKWPDRIPFFSKVSLRREKQNIERMGFRVSLIKV